MLPDPTHLPQLISDSRTDLLKQEGLGNLNLELEYEIVLIFLVIYVEYHRFLSSVEPRGNGAPGYGDMIFSD